MSPSQQPLFRSRRRRAARARARRRGLLAFTALVLLAAAGVLAVSGKAFDDVLSTAAPKAKANPMLVVRLGGDVALRVPVVRYRVEGKTDRALLRRLVTGRLPRRQVVASLRRRIAYRLDVDATVRRAAALGGAGGTVQAVRQAVAARVDAPVVAQRLRNNCESAALQILLATTGHDTDQMRLQRAFPRSGPLDPQGSGPDLVWGDPDRGYVGRPDGGGSAGGFGVYPGPVRSTARRFGARLEDLSGGRPEVVYDSLLAGHAVMAWVGLSDGPDGRWRSPQGKAISVNFGEHTVVLYGIRTDGSVEVSNPLEGTREVWTKPKFEAMWALLGRRALSA